MKKHLVLLSKRGSLVAGAESVLPPQGPWWMIVLGSVVCQIAEALGKGEYCNWID